MKFTKLFMFLFLGMILLSLSMPAASMITILGKVNGHVYDDLGKPVASCTVTLSDSTGVRSSATTDSNGYFTMTGAAGIDYSINATRQYYQWADGPATVKLPSSGTATKNLTMMRLPKTVSITPDRNYVYADGTDTITIKTRVLDANDQPINSMMISYFLPKWGNDWVASEGSLGQSGKGSAVLAPSDGAVSVKYGWIPAAGAGTTETIRVNFGGILWIGTVNIDVRSVPTPTPKPDTITYTPTPVITVSTPSPTSGPAPQPNTGGNTGVTVTPGTASGSQGSNPTPTPTPTPTPSGGPADGGPDIAPPVTEATLAGTPGTGTDVYTSDVQVILLANDGAGSGVQSIHYSLDGANWSVYMAPVTVNRTGVNTVYYYSVDNANNTEATHVKPFTVSTSAQFKLPCLNALVLPLLCVGIVALGAARRRKIGR